jgi:hypothetical protein
MYAGNKAYNKGDFVTMGDLVIPMFEMDWHNGQNEYYFLWDEYVWSSDTFTGMEYEVEDSDLVFAASGG